MSRLFIRVGVATAWEAAAEGPIDVRLKRDVFAYKPSVVTIMLGMNDASYRPFDAKIFETYSKGYDHIVDSLKENAPGVRLTLIQPSPYDDVTRKPSFEGGYNAVLLKYADFVKDLASKKGATVADLNTGLVEATKKANEIDHDRAVQFNFDRVHPGPAGQLLMAEGLLKAWDAPSLVASVSLDVDAASSVKAENTTVSDLIVGEKISWVQEDKALPFPIFLTDPTTALAVKSSDVVEALDREMLKVMSLKGSEYKLRIDGQDVGKFTKEALADGINLAVLNTPMIHQAMKVHELTLMHNNIHYTRWRQVQVPLQGQHLARGRAGDESTGFGRGRHGQTPAPGSAAQASPVRADSLISETPEETFMKRNPVKKALKEGRPQVGTWLSLGNVVAARFLARTGLPWLTVDMEHTHTDIQTAALMFGAIADAGCVPLARVQEGRHDLIKSSARLWSDGDRRADGDDRRRGSQDRRGLQVPASGKPLGGRRASRFELWCHGRGLLSLRGRRNLGRDPDRACGRRGDRRRNLRGAGDRRHLRRPERPCGVDAIARRHAAYERCARSHAPEDSRGGQTSERPRAGCTCSRSLTPTAGSPRAGSSSRSTAS